MDLDTTMSEGLHTHSNRALSCAPTRDSVCGFNSTLFTKLTVPLHLAIYQTTRAISCHVTKCCSVIGLHSTERWNSWL